MSYASETAADSPQAGWDLDETSGSSAADTTGNSRVLTYSGATLAQAGLHDGSTYSALGGASGQGVASIAWDGAWMSVTTLTVAGWVKINNTTDVKGLFGAWGGTGGWMVWQRRSRIGIITQSTAGTASEADGPLLTPSNPRARHIAFRMTGGVADLFVDGVKVATMSGITGMTQTPNFEIGGYNGANYSQARFDGFRYYNTALSDARIAAHHAAGSTRSLTPRAHWTLDEPSGTTMADSSGNGNNGTYSGAILGQTALRGSGFAAKGGTSGQGIASLSTSSGSVFDSTDMTIAFNVKAANNTTSKGYIARWAGSGGGGWIIWQSSGTINYYFDDGASSSNNVGPIISIGTNLRLTITVSSDTVKFYVDGTLAHTRTISLIRGSYSHPLQLGGYGGSNYSEAILDDVKYWDTTLSATEVANEYSGASAVAVSAPVLGVVEAVPAPTVLAGSSVVVAAPALAAVAAVPAPVVHAGTGVTVAAPVLGVAVSLVAPSVEISTAVTVAAPVLAVAFEAPAPTVLAGSVVAVDAPALAVELAFPAPTVTAATAAGLVVANLSCVVDLYPITVEVGGASGVTDVLTANLDCSVEVTPYVLLRPVAPPLGVIAEWPVERQAHVMAALSAANPRYSGGIDYDIERDLTGRLHVFVGGTDVTYFRDMPCVFEDWSSSVPFGPESARIAMPQFKPWDNPGSGSVSMFREDAPVEIALVRPDDTIDHLWEGFLAVEGDQSGQSSEDYTFTADGLFAQAAHELYDPPVVMGERDYGHIIADVLNSVTHRRWTKIPRFTTGETTAYRGEQGQMKWQYVQDLLSRCYDDTDRQLTIARVAPYTYRIQWKKAVSGTVDWTVTKGAPGVSVNLERNHAARVDAIYGRGYAKDGGFHCGRVFPGLEADVPPVYPMAGFANIDVGTSDSETTSGVGVSTWQRKMRDLGYPVTVDGVMNSSDTKWVLKIQRARGITVDGSLGPQTWAATWENNSIEGDFTTYRLPYATRTQVEPNLYAANGAIKGKNPGNDQAVIRHAIEVDFKTNISKAASIALAGRMLARLQDVGYQGTITLLTDPHEAGSSRFDVKPGDNLHVIGHHGGVTVQVSEVSASGLEVTLTVDSLARDAEVVASQLDRAEEARRDLSGRTGGSDSSRLNNGTVVQYEAESKAGRISRTAVNGNSGLWTVRKAFVSQVGVAKVAFETSPKAELVVALFNRPIRTSVLASLAADPLTSSDGWYDNVETLQEKYGLMEVFGSPDSPGGYWPRQKGDGALTGRLRDSSSSLYDSPYGGFVWVAMFTSRSTWVEGRVFPAVPT